MPSAPGVPFRRISQLGITGLFAPRAEPGTRPGLTASLMLGGVKVDLKTANSAVSAIIDRAAASSASPLGVLSANLDHLNHFGVGGRWEGALDGGAVEWLTLLDGAPLVGKAERLTGQRWPRLAGSDLIGPILDKAADQRLSVGFLGGSRKAQRFVSARFETQRPSLQVAGWWAPDRQVLTTPSASSQLCAEIRAAHVDILVVCLGKPRQELWIKEYGHLTGANVMLAFGAVIDFLAGDVRRAPARISGLGLEWAWRLAFEPQRLAKRYLVEGPEAYLKLQRRSSRGAAVAPHLDDGAVPVAANEAWPRKEGFTSVTEHASVAALVVAYNNGPDICMLVESLLKETAQQSIKVVVADNSPNSETLSCLEQFPGVAAFATGGNLGYAGGINAAYSKAGPADAYLVLNPDLKLCPGAVMAMRKSMESTGAGVVVPLLRDDDGSVYPSLRREPTISRALGDAFLGSRLKGRPGWLTEMDFDLESYAHPHKVDWATGAALLIRSDIARKVGGWDESYFLYSEETDYLHRVRAMGGTVWFQPLAVAVHSRGGSGSAPSLDALMGANRIRYIRKFHAGSYARTFRAAVVLSALLRAPLPAHRGILGFLTRESRWADLPHAVTYPWCSKSDEKFPYGAVIIPAHNEAAVLGRTLAALKAALASGNVDVVVACNGCTDGTATVAGSVPGVRVVCVEEASKTAALNAGDQATGRWPRLYVDADIEVPVAALRATLEALSDDGGPLCARPAFTYDTAGASWMVRAYYRARNRLPQASASMWGAGVYGLSRKGHERLGAFPSVTADDCYIDRLFETSEKATIACPPVTVRTPRTGMALLATLKRVYRGNSELRHIPGAGAGRTVRQLAHSITGPGSAMDAAVYAAFALAGRAGRRRKSRAWERDDSSRNYELRLSGVGPG